MKTIRKFALQKNYKLYPIQKHIYVKIVRIIQYMPMYRRLPAYRDTGKITVGPLKILGSMCDLSIL